MTRSAVARQAFNYLNSRPPAGFAAADYPRGRFVRNLFGAQADLTNASWSEQTVAGSGDFTENGTKRRITVTADGLTRLYFLRTVSGLVAGRWYACGFRVSDFSGSFSSVAISNASGVSDGEQTISWGSRIDQAGRWCIRFQANGTSASIRMGIGCTSVETCVEGEYIELEDPFLYEIADANEIPAEWVGANPVIIPYDNPCSITDNLITQAAYGSVQPYKRSDVVLFAGDSFGNDSSEYPTLIRNAYEIEAHNIHVSGGSLGTTIKTALEDYVAAPTTNAPAYLTPRVCVLQGGVNDLINDPGLTTMQNRLNALLTIIRDADMIPVVLNVAPWSASASWSAGKQATTESYNAWLLARSDILTVDVYAPLVGTTTELAAAYDSGDGLHPNATGQAVIQARVTNALKRIAAAIRD